MLIFFLPQIKGLNGLEKSAESAKSA